jgi:hypothetical protein
MFIVRILAILTILSSLSTNLHAVELETRAISHPIIFQAQSKLSELNYFQGAISGSI